MSSLPSHREFLTSLITSLSNIPPPTSPTPSQPTIPPDRRQLLLTLHVLFPSLLLPALDLLDRKLITRISVIQTKTEQQDLTGGAESVFIVKSVGTTISRRRDKPVSSRRYIVRLSCWNCSCASFTLDAFPSTLSTISLSEEAEHDEDGVWSFGGLSLDGCQGKGEDVPCCKHLLACLLGERWPGVMGIYLEEMNVTPEELAGVIAGL